MLRYTVTAPDSDERGIRVGGDEHAEVKEFQPEYPTVAFCCDRCGYEVEIRLHDLHDWQAMREMC